MGYIVKKNSLVVTSANLLIIGDSARVNELRLARDGAKVFTDKNRAEIVAGEIIGTVVEV